MGKGNNNKTTQKVTADPWAPLQPYLKGAFGDAQSAYKEGAPGYFPGQTVAPMSGYTQQSLDALAARGAGGSALTRGAQDEMSRVLSGEYLKAGNPYLQQAISAATRPILDAFEGQIMPGIDSAFSSAGRYGSGLQGEAYRDAQSDLTRNIGDVASNMAFQNYGAERNNMMNAMQFAPSLAGADYKDIAMLGMAGEGFDRYNQALIDAEKAKYDYEANKDMQWIGNYLGLLGGAPPPAQTTTTKTPAPSPWATIAGLGLQAGSALAGMPFYSVSPSQA